MKLEKKILCDSQLITGWGNFQADPMVCIVCGVGSACNITYLTFYFPMRGYVILRSYWRSWTYLTFCRTKAVNFKVWTVCTAQHITTIFMNFNSYISCISTRFLKQICVVKKFLTIWDKFQTDPTRKNVWSWKLSMRGPHITLTHITYWRSERLDISNFGS